MSVSLLTSNLKVTGSNTLYAPNLTGIGGTLILQSGQFVLISGVGQGGAGNSNVSVTGSAPIAAPNFSGIGGTVILQSGNFVLVSGASQALPVDHGDGINLSGQLTLTGQTAQNNALNLSGSLFATGSTLVARDLATSGELDRRLVSTGSNAWNNTINLSGNLNASGRRAWDDATNLSGRLAATGALLSAVQVTGSSIIQNANFTGYGSTFVFYSGGFILISGAPSVAASVDHGDGINLSGRLFTTGSSLDNKINSVSGWTDMFFVHRTGDELITGNKTFSGVVAVTGRVGIGTLNPGYVLHVVGNSNLNALCVDQDGPSEPVLRLSQNGTTRANWTTESTRIMYLYGKNAFVYPLVVRDEGKIGMGTYSPDENLHVTGAIRTDTAYISGSQNIADVLYPRSNPSGFLPTGGLSATAAAGTATLPANPVGFLIVNITGGNFKIPYYNI